MAAKPQPDYQIEDGHLLLRAKPGETNLFGAVIAHAPTAADYTATVVVDSGELNPHCAAGLWAYGDAQNNLGLSVSRDSVTALRQDRGVWRQLSPAKKLSGAKVFLRVTARRGGQFELSASEDAKSWQVLGNTSDAKDIPPWDRSARIALSAGGAASAEARFESFSMQNVASARE